MYQLQSVITQRVRRSKVSKEESHDIESSDNRIDLEITDTKLNLLYHVNVYNTTFNMATFNKLIMACLTFQGSSQVSETQF